MTNTTTTRHPRTDDPTTEIDPAADLSADGEQPGTGERVRIELSATQLVAGALAAMTAAVAGAQLGVAGTVIGAALGSVVAGVASSLYTASLHRGRQALARTPLPRPGRPTPTAVLPRVEEPVEPTPQRGRTAGLPRRRWRTLLVTAGVVFVLAVGGLTAVELITGNAVSGGSGTTISQVGEGGASRTDGTPDQRPADDVSETPTDSPSETPSDVATDDPTPTPSEEASETPSETPSEAPTEVPTDDSTETPSVEPTPTPDPTEPPTTTP